MKIVSTGLRIARARQTAELTWIRVRIEAGSGAAYVSSGHRTAAAEKKLPARKGIDCGAEGFARNRYVVVSKAGSGIAHVSGAGIADRLH